MSAAHTRRCPGAAWTVQSARGAPPTPGAGQTAGGPLPSSTCQGGPSETTASAHCHPSEKVEKGGKPRNEPSRSPDSQQRHQGPSPRAEPLPQRAATLPQPRARFLRPLTCPHQLTEPRSPSGPPVGTAPSVCLSGAGATAGTEVTESLLTVTAQRQRDLGASVSQHLAWKAEPADTTEVGARCPASGCVSGAQPIVPTPSEPKSTFSCPANQRFLVLS